jgi:hypothetical protein
MPQKRCSFATAVNQRTAQNKQQHLRPLISYVTHSSDAGAARIPHLSLVLCGHPQIPQVQLQLQAAGFNITSCRYSPSGKLPVPHWPGQTQRQATPSAAAAAACRLAPSTHPANCHRLLRCNKSAISRTQIDLSIAQPARKAAINASTAARCKPPSHHQACVITAHTCSPKHKQEARENIA